MRLSLLYILFTTTSFIHAQLEDSLYRIADSLLTQAADFQNAIPVYNQLIEIDPENDIYYRGRGMAFLSVGQAEKSESDLNTAIRLNPNCSNCYVNLGRIAAEKGDDKRAIDLLDRAIDVDDTNDYAYFVRGLIRSYYGDNLLAKLDFNKAIRLNSDNGVYYTKRGEINLAEGYFSLAFEDLNKGVQLEPQNYETLYARARAYILLEDWDAALKDIEKTIALRPDHYLYYSDKGAVLDLLGRSDEALQSYNQSVQLDSTRYHTYYSRAMVNYALENMDDACTDFQNALRLLPVNPENIELQQFLQLRIDEICNPDKASYYYQRGIAHYNLNEFEKAIEQYNNGLKQFPHSPFLLSFKGNALYAKGEYTSALEVYNEFLSNKGKIEDEIVKNERFTVENPDLKNQYRDGSVASVYSSMAECYANLAQFEEALKYADSSISLLQKYSNDDGLRQMLGSALNVRGVIHLNLGEPDLSRQDLIKAMEYDPANPYPIVNLALVTIQPKKGSDFKTGEIRMYINSDLSTAMKGSWPQVNRKKISEAQLYEALKLCNRAIEMEEKTAYAYLVRAQVKLLLNEQGVCLDLMTAREYGLLNALELIDVNCSK